MKKVEGELLQVVESWQKIWDQSWSENLDDKAIYEKFLELNHGWDYQIFEGMNRWPVEDDIVVRFSDERGGNDRHYFVYFEASEDAPMWLIGDYSISEWMEVMGHGTAN